MWHLISVFTVHEQALHSLEKYLNMEGFLEKSLNIKSALKSVGKWLLGLEEYLDFTIFGKL